MGYKVLLVEDDHDIREAVADYFTGVEASDATLVHARYEFGISRQEMVGSSGGQQCVQPRL